MENKRLLSVSILILSISITFGAFWVGRALENIDTALISSSSVITEKGLFTESESAEYLNISLEQFKNILLQDERTKSQLSSYSTYQFIPYIELSDGVKMFSKKELDKWIEYNSLNK